MLSHGLVKRSQLLDFLNVKKHKSIYLSIITQTALKLVFFPLTNLGLQHIQIYYYIYSIIFYCPIIYITSSLLRYLSNYQFLHEYKNKISITILLHHYKRHEISTFY